MNELVVKLNEKNKKLFVTVSEIYLYVEHCLGDGAVGATAEATIT
jgi:hypothetical protein